MICEDKPNKTGRSAGTQIAIVPPLFFIDNTTGVDLFSQH